jgi:dTDP-4-dehydrorhamnose 3,5-epimerase
MNFIEQEIPGVFIIEPKVNIDPRGYFMESWKKAEFEKHIGPVEFIQDNESKSTFGVLRGLHAQSGAAAQAKLVRVIQGAVLDVVVDGRKNSPTFGKFVAVELSAENKLQLFVPRGFYHGFLVLTHETIFSYKVDNPYNHASEVALNYADPTIGIEWPVDSQELVLSPKDIVAPFLNMAYKFE